MGVHYGGHSCNAGFAALRSLQRNNFCSIPPRFCASLPDVALASLCVGSRCSVGFVAYSVAAACLISRTRATCLKSVCQACTFYAETLSVSTWMAASKRPRARESNTLLTLKSSHGTVWGIALWRHRTRNRWPIWPFCGMELKILGSPLCILHTQCNWDFLQL